MIIDGSQSVGALPFSIKDIQPDALICAGYKWLFGPYGCAYGYFGPYFDNGKAWDFKTLERNIYLNTEGNFAWFDELLNTWMGTCRGSGVLEKKDNSWAIKHYVLSVSIPNDDIQKVIAAKQEKDSIFLSSFKK